MHMGARERIRWTDITGRPTDQGSGLTEDQAAIVNALLDVTGIGMLVRTDSGFVVRSIVRSGDGLRITNGSGLTGNPTIALADDLAAIEALSATGWLRRSGTNAWTLNPQLPWADLTGTPTTAVGYGIANGNELDAFAALGDGGGFVEKLGDGSYQLTALAAVATSGAYSDLSGTPTIREVLTGNRTYYVATTGNDANDGLTALTPFLTIQKAIDVVYGSLDLGIYDVTIQLADGTYTEAAIVNAPAVGTGNVLIQGNTGTPANVIWTTTTLNTVCLEARSEARIQVGSLEMQASGAGVGCAYANRGRITFKSGMRFGTSTTFHAIAARGGLIEFSANYDIVGGASYHWFCTDAGSNIVAQVITITLTGTPAFSIFVVAETPSFVLANGNTFSGAATGTRYLAVLNGVIQTGGGGATYFPGNVAGSTATGGQYA